MEFERTLFRVYDKIMTNRNVDLACKVVGIACFIGGLVSFAFLILFHCRFVGESSVMLQALADQVFMVPSVTMKYTQSAMTAGNVTVYSEDKYTISVSNLRYEFSTLPNAFTLPDTIRERKGFKNYKVTLDREALASPVIWVAAILFNEVNTILINQCAYAFGETAGVLLNKGSKREWVWSEDAVPDATQPSVLQRLWNALRAVCLYFMLSFMSGLTCRLSYMSASVLFVVLASCLRLCRVSEETRLVFYYSFPWVGFPAYSLNRTNRSAWAFILAYGLMFVTFYYMYQGGFLLWAMTSTYFEWETHSSAKIFLLALCIEFFSLVFVRTKRSVAFFPKSIAALFLGLLIYQRNHFCPFTSTATCVVMFFSGALAALCVKEWELKTFQQEGPSLRQPRLMYQPVFSRVSPLFPPVWTIFYPVEPRGYFTAEETANLD